MNLILLFASDFVSPNRVRLSDRRCAHVREVHQAHTGDALRVGLLNGKMGTGTIASIDSGEVILDVSIDADPPAPLPFILLLALPRPKCLRRIIHATTALGIKKIFLFRSWRVEQSYWQTPLLAPEILREEMLLGLEQARDTVLPEIEIRHSFKPFMQDEAPELIKGAKALMAHPGSADPCPCEVDGPAVIAIGPEGGFIPYEIDLMRSLGFLPVNLGPRVLRTEQAVPVMIGRMMKTGNPASNLVDSGRKDPQAFHG